ncbi:MAG: Gfo/Idh/MocA family oxidoreductase [Oscillospiraceae bacterium]|nr:Gfo/Idh/MocA family oxidoreductase [Oscillospiraceae bacterium]
MTAKLKTAVVGMGGIGNTHAGCYDNDDLAELVAVCDLVPEKADEAADKFDAKAFYSVDDMLTAMPEIDAVSITTSGYDNGSMHFEPAYKALEYGKAVLCEKPICNELEDAKALVAFAKEKGLYLGCDLNHYFTETSDKAREYMKNGKIGETVYVLQKMGFNGSENIYNGAGSPRWQTPYSHIKAFLAHPFSLMRYYCGDITHIQAFLDRPGIRRAAGDPMLSINSVHMKFADGGVGYIISQRGDSNFGLGGWWSFELSGTKGAFCIENCVEKLTYWPGTEINADGDKTTPETEVFDSGITDFGATFPRRIHAFLEDVTNGVHPDYIRASGRDALATLECTFAAIKSYESGGELVQVGKLPPLHGDIRYVF